MKDLNLNEGWIIIWRKLKDNAFYTQPLTLALWIHLLLSANHRDKEIIFNRKPLLIKRGQLVTGLYSLSKQTGISIQSLRTALDTLKSTGSITRQVTSKFSIISILRYEDYQLLPTGKPTDKLTSSQQAANRLPTTNNTCNTLNNDNKDIHTGTIDYLISLKDEEAMEIATKYGTTRALVKSKAEDLVNYCKAHGKKYKDYRAFLLNAVKRGLPKVVEVINADYKAQNN